jgi:hypothetical protein
VVGTSIEATIEAWIADLSDHVSVSASAVQDRLLDIWGALPEGEVRRQVENWLTETLDRELYMGDDVISRLQHLAELETV